MEHAVKLAIVVPCFNEQDALLHTSNALVELISGLIDANEITRDSKIWFVDDGSTDRTWSVIESLCVMHAQICGIKLSRNFGHQSALLAGMFTAEGDAIVTIDADLQDDVAAIGKMLLEFKRGAEIVYGVRGSRESDTYFKRSTAEVFYRLMQWAGVDIVFNHADFRLMSKRAVELLKEHSEVNLFLRGIIPQIGLRSATVYFDRSKRIAGETKYPLKKMLSFALDGITSFSVTPLRFITLCGIAIFIASTIMSLYVVWTALWLGGVVPGWASTVLPIYMLGGIQLFCIGILGEYLGKVYKEVKRRPRYLIDQVVRSTAR